MNAMLSMPCPALTLGELQAYEGVTSIEARMAMREVKRVLARTEPDRPEGRLYLTAHKREGYHSGLHGWPGGRDALAESLAAFCAADDPASYLAGVR